MGASKIAKALGKTHKQVINKANKLKLKIDKKTARMIVHSKASEYMYKNNPMFNDKVKRKVKKFWSDNPEKYQEQMKKLFTGHSKLRKDKPTKLEKKLYNILGAIGVPFDKQAIIKPKFIVDAKIGNLIIEADGDWWHGHKRLEPLNERQIKQQVRDKSRNKYLTTCGYKVERIWESDMSYDVVVGILKKHNII